MPSSLFSFNVFVQFASNKFAILMGSWASQLAVSCSTLATVSLHAKPPKNDIERTKANVARYFIWHDVIICGSLVPKIFGDTWRSNQMKVLICTSHIIEVVCLHHAVNASKFFIFYSHQVCRLVSTHFISICSFCFRAYFVCVRLFFTCFFYSFGLLETFAC